MDTLDRTPTRPRDYAALTAAYAAGTTVVARVAREADDPIRLAEIVPLGAATFTVSKALTREKVEVWVREPFLDDGPGAGEGPARPKGRGLRFAVGELLACSRCTGTWVALGLVGLRLRAPHAGRVAMTIGAVAAVNDVGQAAFARLTRPAGAR